MVAPHPDLNRRFTNTNNIVMTNRYQAVSELHTRYPNDYVDLDTHKVLRETMPWVERQSSLPYLNMESLQNYIPDKVLILCVDFVDMPAQLPTLAIRDRFFSDSGHSLKNYYQEVSYGKYIPEGEVYGWYRAPKELTYYTNNGYGFGTYPNNAQRLVEDTITAAMNDTSINWASFDINNNNYLDNVVIIHSGPEAAITGNKNHLWAHVWEVNNPKSVQGKIINVYALSAEYMTSQYDTQISGVDCHEFGHLLGLPDLYDYSNNSNGVGNYSLMGSGSWANGGLTPVHLDAWSKYKLGYVNVRTDPQGAVSINNIETVGDVIKYTTKDPKEFFMLENRQKILFDSYLPSEGLFIWHVNENQQFNNNENCFLVGLIQADGMHDLENKANLGDLGDPYPGTSNNRSFGKNTTPNSSLCNGTVKDMLISNISDPSNIMTFNADIPATISGEAMQEGPSGAAGMVIIGGLAVGSMMQHVKR